MRLWFLLTPSLGITGTSSHPREVNFVVPPFNSLSRDHRRLTTSPRVPEKSRTFNSLSRDHGITYPRLDGADHGQRRPFNSLSRDHQMFSVNPMTILARNSLSTPSLGITRRHGRTGSWFGCVFQLPLSGSHAEVLNPRTSEKTEFFQLPLSGSRREDKGREAARGRSNCFQLPLSGSHTTLNHG